MVGITRSKVFLFSFVCCFCLILSIVFLLCSFGLFIVFVFCSQFSGSSFCFLGGVLFVVDVLFFSTAPKAVCHHNVYWLL